MSPRAVACSVHQRAQICTDAVWYGSGSNHVLGTEETVDFLCTQLRSRTCGPFASHHISTNIKRPQQNINIKKATSLNLNRGI